MALAIFSGGQPVPMFEHADERVDNRIADLRGEVLDAQIYIHKQLLDPLNPEIIEVLAEVDVGFLLKNTGEVPRC